MYELFHQASSYYVTSISDLPRPQILSFKMLPHLLKYREEFFNLLLKRPIFQINKTNWLCKNQCNIKQPVTTLHLVFYYFLINVQENEPDIEINYKVCQNAKERTVST